MLVNRRPNEIIAHEWSTLRTLWNGCRQSVEDEGTRREIDGLFPSVSGSSDAKSWHELNFAEQSVGAHLTAAQLAVEFQTLLGIAKSRGTASLDTYKSKENLFSALTEETKNLDQHRAIYLSLLHTLQADFIEGRFRRQLRRETATRLFIYGLAVLALALLPLVFYLTRMSEIADGKLKAGLLAEGLTLFSREPSFGLMTVAGFGLLGAYFSRAMSFQSKLAQVGFEDVMNLYQGRMLVLRLLYGLIGAIVFYFILRAGLIGGTAFPELSKISIGEQIVWKADANGIPISAGEGKLQLSGLTILMPTSDLAKLLVWSFLAGFSERLVPDALSKTEAQAKGKENS